MNLKDIYEPIHIMDYTFLHIRGIPTFSGIMEQALKTFKGLGNSFDAKNWCESLLKSSDEDGKRIISNMLNRLFS